LGSVGRARVEKQFAWEYSEAFLLDAYAAVEQRTRAVKRVSNAAG
jgi:hypothetical protein